MDRRSDTERERSKQVRSIPGRKRGRGNRKQEEKTSWKGWEHQAKCHNHYVSEETVEVPEFNLREVPFTERT